jgi:hypothetical protein
MDTEIRVTRAPTIFGAILMVLGSGLWFMDTMDGIRNPHWFIFPAILLMGLGALFTLFGRSSSHR